MFRSFRLHTYSLSSVACLYRSLRNEYIWFLYLNLKVVSDVCFLRGCSSDFSLVYDIFCVTISVHGTRVGFPAVTAFLLIVLKASIKKHSTKVATAIISLSNRARHPDRGILGNEISCGSTLHTARTWQQISENGSFHSLISISLNLTPFIKFLTVTH